MTPRRQRWTLYGIVGGVLALPFLAAAWVFESDLFTYAMDPRKPFQTSTPPAKPDYGQDAAWALRPTAALGRDEAAIFFVHPTTYSGGRHWNGSISKPKVVGRVADWALPNYAGPFRGLGAIWAPLYRQASLYALQTQRFDARRARALAYEDVADAFARFLTEAPSEAPLILVGVEQGGLHVLGLLQQMTVNEAVADRLVAAFVIDQATPLDLFNGPLAHLSVCRTPEAVRCVASWGAVRANHERRIRRFQRRSMAWNGAARLESTEDRALACVNPILWTATEDYAPSRLHRGGVDATGLELSARPAPLAGQTSAQCRHGVLLVDRPTAPSLRASWRWGQQYRPAEANLFYADIAANAAQRLGAFLAKRAEGGGRAPPITGQAIEIKDAPIRQVPG